MARKTNTKSKNQIPMGIRKERNKKERKIKKMDNFEKMVIPEEADGIVDDQKAFKKQQKENAKLLKQEIASQDDLQIGDYEDINGSLVKKHEYSSSALDKVQARKIGRHAILFARQ